MKIKSISIYNYKSIKELYIPLISYGEGSYKSNTAFLVGMNESGKSAVLEAINAIKTGFEDVDYFNICHLPAQEDNEYVEIVVELDFVYSQHWEKRFMDLCGFPKELANNIRFREFHKSIYCNNESADSGYTFELDEIDLNAYFLEKYSAVVNGNVVEKDRIRLAKDSASSTKTAIDEITPNKADPKSLTKTYLEKIISEKLTKYFDLYMPRIQIWKSDPQYLIDSTVDLNEFREDPSTCIPLKNMFHIYGKQSTKQIQDTIDRALSGQARKDELVEKMSSCVTKHLNRVWKEHKIKLRISINGTQCEVFVEDNDSKFTYFKMNQRSDGFKQFVSLILSLSALNESSLLNNRIILIDEPEVHLHPSGVRYMRDEILKIGKNNHVLVSTHSHYMVDTNCPERHWIVSKNKSETVINQLNEDTPIEDDSVLASAFGLNLFKELLPRNIIIVEGAEDKSVISHSINLLESKFFYSIKSAKGASKTYGIAILMNEEGVPCYFLFDDDKDGKDHKKKIIDNLKESFNETNVFTLRDICLEVPQNCTLEDLMPTSFVKDFFEKELSTTFNLDPGIAVIAQLKNQNRDLKADKQKLDSLKCRLSKAFVTEFSSKKKLIDQAPRLVSFISSLIQKLQNETSI